MVRLVPTFTKILAATDFSDDSNYALGFAEELAHKFGAELTVLHVDQPLAPVMVSELSPGLDFGAMSRIAEEQRMMALAELEKSSARLRDSGLKARGILKVGAPFLEIIHTAQADNYDLIVLGTHGHTGLAHVLMGSVAERVVRKAPCPVADDSAIPIASLSIRWTGLKKSKKRTRPRRSTRRDPLTFVSALP